MMFVSGLFPINELVEKKTVFKNMFKEFSSNYNSGK
jgi:hypothetical protein